jgi:hypothetical protein
MNACINKQDGGIGVYQLTQTCSRPPVMVRMLWATNETSDSTVLNKKGLSQVRSVIPN